MGHTIYTRSYISSTWHHTNLYYDSSWCYIIVIHWIGTDDYFIQSLITHCEHWGRTEVLACLQCILKISLHAYLYASYHCSSDYDQVPNKTRCHWVIEVFYGEITQYNQIKTAKLDQFHSEAWCPHTSSSCRYRRVQMYNMSTVTSTGHSGTWARPVMNTTILSIFLSFFFFFFYNCLISYWHINLIIFILCHIISHCKFHVTYSRLSSFKKIK